MIKKFIIRPFRHLLGYWVIGIYWVIVLGMFISPSPVQAGLPGSVWGKIEVELPDGTRMPAPGVVLFRTDWWRWDYCSQGNRQNASCRLLNSVTDVWETFSCCFGDQDGVEATTGTDGSYTFDNNGTTSAPANRCLAVDSGGARRCMQGPKGQVPKQDNGTTNCFDLNWCGLSCGSNPHRIEPYLPVDFVLPGNLGQLGYTTVNATFQPAFVVVSIANDENKGPFDFKLILLSAPSPTPDIHQQSQQQQQQLIEQSYNPSPTFTPAPTGYLGLTNAEFEAKIAAWSSGEITTEEMSLYVTLLARTPGLQSTYCIPKAGGCDTE